MSVYENGVIVRPWTRLEALNAIKAWYSVPERILGYNQHLHVCVYRGDNRNPDSQIRCSIGVLIPEEIYDESFEDYGDFLGLTDMSGDARNLFHADDSDFYKELQVVHDRIAQFEDGLTDRQKVEKFLVHVDKLIEELV